MLYKIFFNLSFILKFKRICFIINYKSLRFDLGGIVFYCKMVDIILFEMYYDL